jgi:MFS family permease
MEDYNKNWLNANVLFISLSALFADLGYQVVLVIFPIFLVIDLHSSVIYFGIASAISYGIGAFSGYLGGKAGDKFGHKKIANYSYLYAAILSLIGSAIIFTLRWVGYLIKRIIKSGRGGCFIF